VAANDKQVLKEVVEVFVKQQKDYNPKEPIRVVCDEGDLYFILYGPDIATGIAGFGITPEAALNDFKVNWNRYKHKEVKT